MTAALHSGLARQLEAAGHVVVACGWCGCALAADLDHDGHDLPNGSRRYCSKEECRTAARNARRRPVTRARRAHERRHGDLIRRHELEDAGQDALPGLPPLPEVPAMEAIS